MTAAHRSSPRWRRRKEARPAEIIAAALWLFTDHGFAATKLDDVALRAGVAKGSIYLYFATKEELFRAVVRTAVVPQVQVVRGLAEAFDGSLAQLLPRLLTGAAALMGRSDVFGVARMVIGESRNFPDLAKIWHDEVVSPVIGALSGVIARGQAAGAVMEGDARLFAFSVIGPLFMAAMFRDVFSTASDDLPDLPCLAAQHADLLLHGLSTVPPNQNLKGETSCRTRKS
jgi:AcrR family transcriptional regulator